MGFTQDINRILQSVELMQRQLELQSKHSQWLRDELESARMESRERFQQLEEAIQKDTNQSTKRLSALAASLEEIKRRQDDQEKLIKKLERNQRKLQDELTAMDKTARETSGELDSLIRKRAARILKENTECADKLEKAGALRDEELKNLIKSGQSKLENSQEKLKMLLREDSQIRVLVITHRDASNLFIENIIREFVRRKYEVDIFAHFEDQNSIRMFSDLDVSIRSASELTPSLAKEYDFIFCGVQSIRDTLLFNRYVFSYYTMNPAIDPIRGSDFTFTWGEEYPGSYDGMYSLMPVGNPKNDTLKSGSADSGRILFLDSGHFPFSREGKRQLAQMLLDICARFPEREVWVKPRWLPDTDPKTMTHKQVLHLYDLIDELCEGKRPNNLTLLMEHLDLQTLIDSSHCVITTCTTAYLDAALRGKGQLIVRGFENEDMYQARNWYFEDYYRLMEDTGCVVDLNSVCDYLPDGLVCRPEHLQKTYCYTSGVSERIVSVMEYICLRFLRKGTWPKTGKYNYENYQSALTAEPQPSYKELKKRRMYCLLEGGQSGLPQNRFISRDIDWHDYTVLQKALVEEAGIDGTAFNALNQRANEERDKYILAHAEELGQSSLDRAYLYMALYKQGKLQELLELSRTESDSIALNYYCGLACRDLGDWARGAEELLRYFAVASKRSFLKYHVEAAKGRKEAVCALFECLMQMEKTEERPEELLNVFRADVLPDISESDRELILMVLGKLRESNGGELTPSLLEIERRLTPPEKAYT